MLGRFLFVCACVLTRSTALKCEKFEYRDSSRFLPQLVETQNVTVRVTEALCYEVLRYLLGSCTAEAGCCCRGRAVKPPPPGGSLMRSNLNRCLLGHFTTSLPFSPLRSNLPTNQWDLLSITSGAIYMGNLI